MQNLLNAIAKKLAAVAAVGSLILASSGIWLTFMAEPAGASTGNTSVSLMPDFTPGAVGGHSSLELGTRVSTDSDGWVTSVRFFKYVEDTSVHTAHIWAQNGTLLGEQAFTNETAEGWQTLTLDTPVLIAAGSQFTVSVYSTDYYFAGSNFATHTAGPLSIDTGYYNYTNPSAFPNQTVGTNYAVDFNFSYDDYLPAGPLNQSGAMKMTLKIDNPGESFIAPLQGTVDNITIDWGDGSAVEGPFNSASWPNHSYSTPGIYHVTVDGNTLSQWGAYGYSAGPLMSVDSFGTLGTTAYPWGFEDAQKLVSLPSSLPPGVTNLEYMLAADRSFNQDISNWNVSTVTNMEGTFLGTEKFNAPLDAWNVSSVTNMHVMLAGSKFNQTLEHWNTSSVQDFSSTFASSKFNQPIGVWDTSSATTMAGMFEGNWVFNQNVSNWDTHNVVSMERMFSGFFNNGSTSNDQANPLLTDGNKWNVSNVQNFGGLFENKPFNQDISNWNVSSGTNFDGMFNNNQVFDQNLSSWNLPSALSTRYMFSGSKFTNAGQPLVADASHWNLSKAQDLSNMFVGSILDIDFSSFDFSSATAMGGTFAGMPNFNNGGKPLTLKTPKLQVAYSMFSGDPLLNVPINLDATSLLYASGMFTNDPIFNQDLSGWNTANLQDASSMFSYALAFDNGGQPMAWNTSSLTSTNAMFKHALSFNRDISGWDFSKVTDASFMFCEDALFNQPVGAWNTANLTWSQSMFENASAFDQPLANWNTGKLRGAYGMFASTKFNQDISGWNTANLEDMRWMFGNTSAFNQPIGLWNTSKVAYTSSMFNGAQAFNQDLSNWDLRKLTSADTMFANSKFNGSVANWNLASLTNSRIMFGSDHVFNQSLATWKTPVLTYAEQTFYDTPALDQDFSGFDINHIQYADNMFTRSGLSPANYSKLLNAWAAAPHKANVTFKASYVKYSAAGQAGRDSLTGTSNWNISDAGLFTLQIPTITTPPTATGITYGQTLASSTLSGGVASVAGSFSFASVSAAPNAGSYEASVTFSPTDTGNYSAVNFTVPLTVAKAARILTSQASSSNWNFDQLFNAAVIADAGTGSPTYAIDSGSSAICSVQSGTGQLTAIRAGTCSVTAEIAADDNYLGATYAGQFNIDAVAPGSATNIAVTTHITDAHVTWGLPSTDGGTDITGYLVSLTDGTNTFTCNAGAQDEFCDITGLDPNTQYSVTVITKAAGGALSSAPSEATVAQTLPSPTPTETQTPSPTPTETQTPSPTPTETSTPTASVSETPTPSASASPTDSAPANQTATPSDTPSPTASDTASPTLSATDATVTLATPTDTPAGHVDLRPYKPIDPIATDPAGVAQKTVAAVTLVTAVSAAGAAVAAAAGAASGAASGAAASGSAGGASGGSGGAAGAKAESKGEGKQNDSKDSLEETAHLRHLAKGRIDDALKLADAKNWGDKLPLWAVPAVIALDVPPKRVARSFARILPLASKLFVDGTYLRAMFGSLWLIPTFVAAGVAALGVSEAHGLLVLPSTAVLSTIVAIGIFDVFAGFVGAAVLALGLAFTAGIWSAGDVRFLFGIIALGVTPRLIAGAFRTLRRPRLETKLYLWERFIDLVAAPMLAAWASLQIVRMLPVLSGIDLPVENLASVIPTLVAVCMLIRVALEEIAGRFFPIRIEITQPEKLPQPPVGQLLVSITLRFGTFAFIAASLIGVSWHLYVGALLFVLPNLLTIVQNRLPNSTTLYHLMPQGLATLALTLWLGALSLVALTAVFGETPELARIGFVLLPLPSLAMSILKLFGRHGKSGEPRFYAHPRMVWFYRVGGLVVLYLTAELIHVINTTNLF